MCGSVLPDVKRSKAAAAAAAAESLGAILRAHDHSYGARGGQRSPNNANGYNAAAADYFSTISAASQAVQGSPRLVRLQGWL